VIMMMMIVRCTQQSEVRKSICICCYEKKCNEHTCFWNVVVYLVEGGGGVLSDVFQ
jgi:hypothetical protein